MAKRRRKLSASVFIGVHRRVDADELKARFSSISSDILPLAEITSRPTRFSTTSSMRRDVPIALHQRVQIVGGSSTNRLVRVSVVTVADRRERRSTATSPKNCPTPRRRGSCSGRIADFPGGKRNTLSARRRPHVTAPRPVPAATP